MKFRKRPVVVEAVQWTGENSREVNDFVPGSVLCWSTDEAPCISTLEGMMRAEPGDWIVQGAVGEFYPCKPDAFAASFEPADVPVPPAPPALQLTRQEAWELERLLVDVSVPLADIAAHRAPDAAVCETLFRRLCGAEADLIRVRLARFAGGGAAGAGG